MTHKTNKILQQFKTKLIKRFGEEVNDVVLFGSQASGDSHDYSDYDILIILNKDYDRAYKEKLLDLIYNFELEYEVFIDFKIISVHELTHSLRGKQPLFQDAIKNGVHL
jgi:predicted nucleotidyltransferase